MSNSVLQEAILLHSLGYPALLTDSKKNPGIVGGDWGSYEWTAEKFADHLKKRPDLQLGLLLWPLVDVEIDAPEKGRDEFIADAKNQLEEFGADVVTPAWQSRRGEHRLFTLSDTQQALLLSKSCPAVVKIGNLEIRMGAGKAAQSLIPPSTTDGHQREWISSLASTDPAPIPPKLFDAIVDAIRPADKDIGEARDDRPGDVFNERASWKEILEPHGWTFAGEEKGGVLHWVRPGKKEGVSATTGFCDSTNRRECLYIFSTAPEISPLEAQRSYSKFEAYTALNFEGDFSGASSALAEQGYVPHDEGGDEFEAWVDEPAQAPEVSSPELPDFVFNNPLGRYVLANDKYTEPHRDGVLYQLWELFGNYLGKHAKFPINNSIHYANGFLAVVGSSSEGRKGTSYRDALAPFARSRDADMEDFVKHSIVSGLSSGEGLISRVSDDSINTDGRAIFKEEELNRLMACAHRKESTLSAILREAYDGGTLAITTKNNPLTASNAHVSLIVHSTPNDFNEQVSRGDILNGFLNRFVIVEGRRDKVLPFPGSLPQEVIDQVAEAIAECREWVFNNGEGRHFYLAEDARDRWATYYTKRAKSDNVLEDTLVAREPSHVMRFSMRHAALDMTEAISLEHLESAFALWNKAYAFAMSLLGAWAGENDEAKVLYDHISSAGSNGVTRSEIYRMFNNRVSAKKLDELLVSLRGKVREAKVKTGKSKKPIHKLIAC